MKKIIAFFCGCNKPSKTTKKRKSVQVGMTKKDWAREDAHLKWVNKQIFDSVRGLERQIVAKKPIPPKTKAKLLDPTYRMLGIVK